MPAMTTEEFNEFSELRRLEKSWTEIALLYGATAKLMMDRFSAYNRLRGKGRNALAAARRRKLAHMIETGWTMEGMALELDMGANALKLLMARSGFRISDVTETRQLLGMLPVPWSSAKALRKLAREHAVKVSPAARSPEACVSALDEYRLERISVRKAERSAMPQNVRAIVAPIATRYGIELSDILGCRRSAPRIEARRAAIVAVHQAFPKRSYGQIGHHFGLDHTTVIYHLRQAGAYVPRQPGMPPLAAAA